LLPTLMVAGQDHFYRHFLYGATDDTLARLRQQIGRLAPRADIVGSHAPPYRPPTVEEDEAIIGQINACRPDIVWIGLSTPKQERWMAAHRGRLHAPVLIGVGAAFDITAGLRRRAPRVLRWSGLEWAFRLAQEPRRLAGRYLRNNPAFLAMVMAQKIGLRQFPLHGTGTR